MNDLKQVTVTDAASKKIKEFIERRGRGAGIKIGVKTTGCSGLSYTMEYIDSVDYDESVINFCQPDFSVIVEKRNMPYLAGTTIDFVRNGLHEGFEFQNPNERDRCGCGESFRV